MSTQRIRMTNDDKLESHRVWDLPTRLFHWSLLLLVIACWWTAGEDGDIDWHMRCGYAVLALLLFRLVWGVLGSTTARFSSFITSPRAALEYLFGARRSDALHAIGHNPAGGWMVLVLLGTLLLVSITGLFANDDIMSEGPLAHYVSERYSDLSTSWHKSGFYFLLVLVGLHIAAIAFYLLVKKENLVQPMLTGLKHLPRGIKLPELHTQEAWLALLILGCTSAAVWLMARFA